MCVLPDPVTADNLDNNHFYAPRPQARFTFQTYGTQLITPQVMKGQTPGGPMATKNTFIGTNTFGSLNGALNPMSCATSPEPSWCSGGDLGAWINAAAATCTTALECTIDIPPTAQTTITTPIVYVNNETIQCPASNQVNNNRSPNSNSQLVYNGTGTAITMHAFGGRLVGCDLLLGSSVNTGIDIAGYSNWVRDAGVRVSGSSTTTTLIHIGNAGIPTEDCHVADSRLSNFSGFGITIDHANDTFLTNDTIYGASPNTTSTSILLDSAATGTQMDNIVGGSSGKNFLKVQYTMGGNFPLYVFAHNTQCDIPAGDCYLFDSSLGGALLDYTFLNCWAAGAGGSGIHISGGSGLRFEGCIVRENGKDGFTLDNASSNGIFIDHNLIEGNNQSNSAFNGITVSAHVNALSVTGNIIQNFPETGGNQGYAFSTSSDIEGLIFANNFCSNNVTGCANLSSVGASKLTYFGNLAIVSGVSRQPQYFLGPITAQNFQATQGSACSTGNFAVSGWGRGASVGSVSGYSQTCQFTLASGSASFSSAPTFTFRFPAAFSAAPVCTAEVQAVTGTGGAIIFNNSTPSATAPVFTATRNTGAAFTPAASETYKVVVRCGP
jgi:hypothetical protein